MPFNTNAFPKQTGYMPRLSKSSGSGDSGASQANSNTGTSNASQDAGSPTSPTGRRRSSAGSGLFSGLADHKRSSIDAQARKNSFDEMKPGSQGVLAGMWNNFTKGSGK